ncbi:MAG: FtsX-like permease family protein [Gammaproteobacteria bacterium]
MKLASVQTQIYFTWLNAWRMLWRDWRAGELNILALGLLIAVTSITAVGFFIDRVERGMKLQAAELIGADLVIASSRDDMQLYAETAAKNGFSTANTTSFRSVVLGEERPQLVEVKAVTDNYPLRGTLRIADAAFETDRTTSAIPASGELWVETRLLQLLNIEIGSALQLGKKQFVVSQVLSYEPDRGGDFFSVAPRVLMNANDLAATQLIQQGALVNYRLLIGGTRKAIEDYREQLEADLQSGQQLLSVEDGRPELQRALASAQRFLTLAAIISVLLAGVAIATVAYRFSRRHLDTSAMLRCLGASQGTIIRLFSLEMMLLALIVSSAGCVLGFLTQIGIAQILDQLLLVNLPASSFKPLLLGYATGIIMLVGFALPPLLALKSVPPLRVLRRDATIKQSRRWTLYLTVFISIGLILQWQMNDAKLVAFIMAGMVLTLMVLAASALGLVHLLSHLRHGVDVAWRFGLANIARRRGNSVVQIVAFGLGIMILLLLSTVRTDLLRDWQRSLPPDAPNHFIINIQSDQVSAITEYFNEQDISHVQLYPMVRARLVAINDVTASADNYESERARHMVTREFNLSWAEQPQLDNTIVAGQWWQASDHGTPLLSLEEKLAQTLQISIGDKISFDINGTHTDFEVSNLRSVDWDTFNINFFTVVPPGVLENVPASWVTSIYLDETQKRSLMQLVKTFPNLTVVDVEIIMQRVRDIMDRVILAVEFIFIFTLLAGLAVLYAAIQSNQDERRYENAVLRTLGARKSVLLRGLVTEFITLGALSGFLGGIAASATAFVLAEYIFEFDYQFDFNIAVFGIIAGVSIVGVSGVLGTYNVLTHPPVRALRQEG